jgi:hypothetical protein
MLSRRTCLLAGTLLGGALPAPAESGRQRVLSALPALHALTAALCTGTAVDAVRLPAKAAVPMEALANALSRQDADVFRGAHAVVTLGSLWRADPLFRAARAHNLRLVDIDAAYAWDDGRLGLAVMRLPVNEFTAGDTGAPAAGLSPFAWLSPINAMRMAGAIASDLARLSPGDAQQIKRNLAELEGRIRRLKADCGARLAKVADPRVASLADEFVYLFEDFGIPVDGWFVKQDVAWTDADRAKFTQHLRQRDLRVVVHKWMPSDTIQRAITDAGARLLVLDTGNPGLWANAAMSYEALVQANLVALLSGFEPQTPKEHAP